MQEEPPSHEVPLLEAHRVPVTAWFCGASILLTIALHVQIDLGSLFMSTMFWRERFWQPFTSIFPHLDGLHLGLNLYWLWRLGTQLEMEYGSARALGLYAYFALVSSCVQFAVEMGGMGLSGVVYGIFGFDLILRKQNARFAECLGRGTVLFFAIGFFLGVALHHSKILLIGNYAHCAGFLAGAMAGYAALQTGFQRRLVKVLLAFVLVEAVLAASIFRVEVNRSGQVYDDLYMFGVDALAANDLHAAEYYFRKSLRIRDDVGATWHNLGLVLSKDKKRSSEAADAYYKGWKFDPRHEFILKNAFDYHMQLGREASQDGKNLQASIYFDRATQIDPRSVDAWKLLGDSFRSLGRYGDEAQARSRVYQLERFQK